ncbi:MAG: hypothetical protein ACXACD_10960 [Candidatus Thorarchaeota archaeon]|jgi:hypothetical protein
MTLTEDFNEYQLMEDDLQLFNIRIQGVKIWERIRVQVYTAIERRNMSENLVKPTARPKYTRLKRFLMSAIRISRNPFFASKSDIIFIGIPRRVLEDDGLWWDIYTDPIIQLFDSPPVCLESHFKDVHYTPAKTPGLRYLDIIDFFAYLGEKIGIVRVTLNPKEVKLLGRIRDEIRKRFDVDIDVLSMSRRILEIRKARLPLYIRLLKRLKPKVIVLAQGYNREDIIEACKKQGVEVVELQHGAIYPFHPGYSYGGKRKKEYFADYILTWGDYWKSSVPFPIPKNNVISTGFPYLEQMKEKYSKVKRKKQILFISQNLVGETLSKYAVALSEAKEFEYEILYKFHPGEYLGWSDTYPWLLSSRVTVVDPTKKTLHELFAESMIQVGVCSTALFEGLAYGLQTYVIDALCIDLMNSVLETGLVRKVTTPKELLDCINKYTEFEKIDSRLLFKQNAAKNIVNILYKIGRGNKGTS